MALRVGVALLACLASFVLGADPIVTIKNGTLVGNHSTYYNQDFFLGVPFAQPPVNSLRFKNPASITTGFGTLQAKQYAPECVGYGPDSTGQPQSEDCLYLNVIRPSGYDGQKLPVAVWIHASAFTDSGTRDIRFNLSYITKEAQKMGKPIIAVSMAYRLSAWGFLASSEVTASGQTNLGLKDQRLALHWIQENIAAFGGDQTKVTIWGESSGGASVGYQILAFNGRDDGLFRAGIMESGNPVSEITTKKDTDYQGQFNAVVAAAGCSLAFDKLGCLRLTPFAILNTAIATVNTFTAPPLASSWWPIVDGDLIVRYGSAQLADGAFVKVPIIIGANTDEGTSFSPFPIYSTDDIAKHLNDTSALLYLKDPNDVAGALAAYPNDTSIYIPAANFTNLTSPPIIIGNVNYYHSASYYGDAVVIANRRGACQVWARNGVPAYCYRFNTLAAQTPTWLGVTHFEEVAFVFNNTNGYGYSTNPFLGQAQSYFDLAVLMSRTWASFVYDLDVNNFNGRYPKAQQWPVYDNSNPQDIVWDANVTSLAYAEPDNYRAAGMQWILDHAASYQR